MIHRDSHDRLFTFWFILCTVTAIGGMAFLAWIAYLLAMHFTHGGAS